MLTHKQIEKIYGPMAIAVGEELDIPYTLILAIIKEESNGEPFTTSKNGFGIMNITEEMLNDYNSRFDISTNWYTIYDVYSSPQANINVGGWWLGQLLIMFNKDHEMAIRAYKLGVAGCKHNPLNATKYWHNIRKHETIFML